MKAPPAPAPRRLLLFVAHGALLFLLGLALDTPEEIWNGLMHIVVDPDYLITDYMEVGGVGAALVNSALLTWGCVALLFFLRVEVRGITVAAVFTVSGFALFGKNVANIWFVMAGVALFARFRREPFSRYLHVALFGTALAPLVSQVLFLSFLAWPLRFALAAVLGLALGFTLPPLALAFLRIHQGYNLYNVGFTAGMVGTMVVSLARSFGLVPESRVIWSKEFTSTLLPVLIVYFFALALWGLFPRSSRQGLRAIWRSSGRLLSDFTDLADFRTVVANMGCTALVPLGYLVLIGGDLNGPTVGGLFTVAGFAAFGKHPWNVTPILLGVALGGLTKTWYLTMPSAQLAALFSTTLAPIAGEFGPLAGVTAGYLHSSVALSVGALTAGFNLYNNGFAGGLVAAFLVPLLELFRRKEDAEP